MIHVPNGLDEIIDLYGDPRDENGELDMKWLDEWTSIYSLPFVMRTWGGRKTEYFRAHKIVGSVIAECLAHFVTLVGVGYLRQTGYDFWGGCFCYRPMRGYDALSTHSWGIAIDYAPDKVPQGADPSLQDQTLVKIFEDEGFVWGGRWEFPYVRDAMHLQACRGY